MRKFNWKRKQHSDINEYTCTIKHVKYTYMLMVYKMEYENTWHVSAERFAHDLGVNVIRTIANTCNEAMIKAEQNYYRLLDTNINAMGVKERVSVKPMMRLSRLVIDRIRLVYNRKQ